MFVSWFPGKRNDPNEPPPLPRCPRCNADDPVPLGMISSTIFWYTCRQCRHVWGVQSPDTPNQSS